MRVRVEYQEAQGGGHHHHGAGHAGPAPGATARSRLMVFVEDAHTGEPVPYLPVNATIYAERQPAKRVRLVPTVGEQGFHYGADVALPETTTGPWPTRTSTSPCLCRSLPRASWDGRRSSVRFPGSRGPLRHLVFIVPLTIIFLHWVRRDADTSDERL